MIKEYTGYEWGKDFFSFRVPGMDGDGLQAWPGQPGATKTNIVQEMMYLVPDNMQLLTTSSSTARSASPACGSTAGRAVHERGPHRQHDLRRQCHRRAARQFAYRSSTRPAQEVQEERVRHPVARASFDMFDRLEGAVERRSRMATSTYSRPIASRDWPGRWASIRRPSRRQSKSTTISATGLGRNLRKEPRVSAAHTKPPFYACRYFPGRLWDSGRHPINHKAEVLDTEWNPIPGLICGGPRRLYHLRRQLPVHPARQHDGLHAEHRTDCW